MTEQSPISASKLRARLRREGVDATALGDDPMAAFQSWHADWISTAPFDPMLVTLATVDDNGWPSVRAMDLVAADQGFVFFTHGFSPKARDLASSPKAGLCFVWPEIGRQVRVTGHVRTLSADEADAGFQALPNSIRNVARLTKQSEVLPDRTVLDGWMHRVPDPLEDEPGRPDGWIGYRLIPVEIEFWQQRPGDFQDRIQYRRDVASAAWRNQRLSP
ncbi:pyridoxal 5'-phosphate synthase [Paracoccus caeni]|uniref:Pyridoxal 5'-phosphate synthase n=1 Tax=Paracoccus caeni TaxID=657651 RepID=A0A934SFC2_9RHOB|nr:pyridoxal 5'-phosphate synthase [Paracoccus caeni]MBK4217866.1 pyridoxal 5'-phosphate synthase [Paracoccus caeni]